MIAALVAGERARAVRLAARAWEKAGWIDAERRLGIDRLHADDRVRLGWALRILVAVFTWFAIGSGFGFVMMVVGGFHGDDAFGAPLLVLGALCLAGAEIAHGALRTAGMGADDALEISAVGYLWAGLTLALDWDHGDAAVWIFLLGTILLAAAAWRWGGWLFGGLATASAFAMLARLAGGRVLWSVAGLALSAGLLWLGERARLAPSQRAAARAGLVVALAALYAAINYASIDRGLLEFAWLDQGAPPQLGLPRALGALATVVLPVLVLALGVRRRDRLLIGCGLLLATASLATLRWYVHLMPLWILLLLSGALLGAAALALRRFLDSGPERERGGFTAEPLLDGGRRQLVEMAAAVVAFSPAARVPTDASGGGFAGDGGASGGGGATADF